MQRIKHKGPACADDWSWRRIKTEDGLVGWVAECGEYTHLPVKTCGTILINLHECQ